MCIDLCGGYVFMPKHFLHCPKIGAPFNQMRGKAVPKCMWRNCFFYPCFLCKLFNDQKDHYPGQLASPAIQKYNVFVAWLYSIMNPDIFKIDPDIFYCAGTNRHQPFFVAFAKDPYKTHIKIQL